MKMAVGCRPTFKQMFIFIFIVLKCFHFQCHTRYNFSTFKNVRSEKANIAIFVDASLILRPISSEYPHKPL